MDPPQNPSFSPSTNPTTPPPSQSLSEKHPLMTIQLEAPPLLAPPKNIVLSSNAVDLQEESLPLTSGEIGDQISSKLSSVYVPGDEEEERLFRKKNDDSKQDAEEPAAQQLKTTEDPPNI